ncbi:MAG TPA: tRNA (adenosine(37)-N6)-dimethylallyltransferase MiaA [Candidatus Saccharimonadales bacterium]|jgi:tRNA dimethylallyltransferase
MNNQPLIVITGPTASGKSGLALDLAEHYSGEIICADSRTVYIGMDIGTAKPNQAEQARVPHHLLDVVEPGERFTAVDFQRLARLAIDAIQARGKLPFVVGGTGLYIDALVREYEWPEASNNGDKFATYEALTLVELQAMIKALQLSLPTIPLNKRHLIATLLRRGQSGVKRDEPDANTHVVAITTDMDVLKRRIRTRAEAMFAGGVLEEAAELANRYGERSEAMTGNIYPLLQAVLHGKMTQNEAIERFVIKDRQLAKRQLTYLKRLHYIQWLSLDEARNYLAAKIEHDAANRAD